ncbi:related to short chain oxidoreductase (CsgA) [Phialocephala subalpina]|uniref:Related to short chain oxidoreductase (CsgA) n=1 Tax=Phialocephala subalpina TaxID=576137 RepID=A0A1L7X2W1_9HELO|nr:related to short chain oxidoreductase (CsgA) [Phialocephala subalpina]
MALYLITGASRGLGLELARQLGSLPASEVSKVFATARGDAPILEELAKKSSGRVIVVRLDVTNEASIKQAAVEVEANLDGKGLDILINNAGILQYALGVSTMDNLTESFTTNVLGVHWVTRAFIPLLRKGSLKKVVNISSTIGSIATSRFVHLLPAPAYKITKAALNSLTVQYALDYEKEGFTIFALSPGWLRTDLGGETADLSVEQGGKASLEKIFNTGKEQNGQFIKIEIKGWPNDGRNQYDGSPAPW